MLRFRWITFDRFKVVNLSRFYRVNFIRPYWVNFTVFSSYARVSTEAQDITRQIELITAYCNDRNYHLIKIIQEKISGARKDRKSLNELLDVDDAVADMIIVSELSRLSREDDILSVLSTINELLKQGVDILFLDKQDRIYKAGTILSLYDIITLSVEAKASADERYKIAGRMQT